MGELTGCSSAQRRGERKQTVDGGFLCTESHEQTDRLYSITEKPRDIKLLNYRLPIPGPPTDFISIPGAVLNPFQVLDTAPQNRQSYHFRSAATSRERRIMSIFDS